MILVIFITLLLLLIICYGSVSKTMGMILVRDDYVGDDDYIDYIPHCNEKAAS